MTDETAKPTPRRGGKPKARKFYGMGPDIRGGGKGHGVEIENEDSLTPPGLITFSRPSPQHGLPPGFDFLPETPRLVYNEEGRMPRDLEGYLGYWLVSARMKKVLETVDPDGLAFARCDFTLPDGSLGPQYYLCDVVREIDALDEEASKVRIKFEPSGTKIYSFLGGASLVFNENVVGAAHVFRTPYAVKVFCDSTLREACKAAGLTGIQFRDALNF